MPFHSQWGQDEYLDTHVFMGRRDGIFVDIGASDGLAKSNTLFFEQDRGWTGILCEGNPAYSEVTPSNRPASTFMNVAVYSYVGTVEFAVCGEPDWSGVPSNFEQPHWERVNPRGTALIQVPCVTLRYVLSKLPRCDYLSIDVEGAEFNVISTLDKDCCPVEIIGVENNRWSGAVVEEYLSSLGYEKFHTIEFDDFYRKAP